MTVDEILAHGRYTDRRGRTWKNVTHWNVESWAAEPYGKPDILPEEMRLLIERDMHRDVCGGIAECYSHPVVSVIWHRTYEHWLVFNESSFYPTGAPYDALEDALRDASALAVSSD